LPQKARDVEAALLKKGFQKLDKHNPDHNYFLFFHKGLKTSILTKISHGERELRDTLCSIVAKQIRLTNSQFRDFVNCSLEHAHYVKILTDARHIQ